MEGTTWIVNLNSVFCFFCFVVLVFFLFYFLVFVLVLVLCIKYHFAFAFRFYFWVCVILSHFFAGKDVWILVESWLKYPLKQWIDMNVLHENEQICTRCFVSFANWPRIHVFKSLTRFGQRQLHFCHSNPYKCRWQLSKLVDFSFVFFCKLLHYHWY